MSTYKLVLGGEQADAAFYDAVCTLEVVETCDGPGTLTLGLIVSRTGNDLTGMTDERLEPYASVAVIATPDGGAPECIFDGYVVEQRANLDAGLTNSKLDVTCHDASALMDLADSVRAHTGTCATVANAIFDQHGIKAHAANTLEETPFFTDDGTPLMQRESDIAFLRRVARRTGRWCRVTCDGQPGERTGYFAAPSLDGEPVVTIDLTHSQRSQVDGLEFHWDVLRPTHVLSYQASDTDSGADHASGSTSESDQRPLDARLLEALAGRVRTLLLTSAAPPAELRERARAVLRETERFARCDGTTDVSLLGHVLRVGSIVAVENVGALLSGKYLVESVTHTITRQCHQMAFSLARNAIGPAAIDGSGP
jgi:Phage tail baseplate hub (GPD)